MSESENPADAADGTARLEATVGREPEVLSPAGGKPDTVPTKKQVSEYRAVLGRFCEGKTAVTLDKKSPLRLGQRRQADIV